MKNIILSAAVLLTALQAGAFAQSSRLANAGKAGLYVRSLDEVLRLQDEEMDLATAALIASEYWSDFVHGRRYIEQLDAMAYEIRNRLTTALFRSSTTTCSMSLASKPSPTPTIPTISFYTRSWTDGKGTA
jgi:hypothetical protein